MGRITATAFKHFEDEVSFPILTVLQFGFSSCQSCPSSHPVLQSGFPVVAVIRHLNSVLQFHGPNDSTALIFSGSTDHEFLSAGLIRNA